MSYDTKWNKITVNDIDYSVERTPDRGHPEETLTLREFDVEQDEFVNPFPGLSAILGWEEYQEGYSPRDWSNVGTMAVSYGGYDLGDEDISKIDFEIECPHCKGSGENPNGDWSVGVTSSCERLAVGSQKDCQEFIDNLPDVTTGIYYIEPFGCPKCDSECVIQVNPVDYFKQERGARVVLGLTVYEHSGITMYAGDVTLGFDTDRWDTSFVGFTFDTPEGVKQCLGDNATDKEIEAALRSEVKNYASYLEGDVTYWRVEDEETGFDEGCGGYVGDHETCEQECFQSMEDAIVKRLAEMKEREEWNSRDVTTS